MPAIVDTGPLVAFFDRSERHHPWVVARIGEIEPPLLICEPVLTEAMYLLARYPSAADALFGLLHNGALRMAFQIEENVEVLRQLLQKYRDTPMSLADACIVRMAEIHDRHDVLTLDSDFRVYRKHGRVPLQLIHPGE
ncbi:MAG: type II toxin-antitoxin system VapC family toxin [Xanthobacteraceae bacterium]